MLVTDKFATYKTLDSGKYQFDSVDYKLISL